MSQNAMPAVPALALLQPAPTEAATAFGVAFQPDREESGPGDRAQTPWAPCVSTPCNNCLVLASVTLCQRTQRKARIEEPRQSEKAVKEVGGSWGS
jgi:hypothetical protein